MVERPPLWINRHQAGLALAVPFAVFQGLGHDTTLLALMP
jgi:putative phosphoribosyl transferase